MNSEITLEINGYRRDILRYNYRFSRNTDLKGRPTTGVLGGSIYVEMESDGDNSILDMMLVDMNKPRPCFFFRAEPAVVSGRIRHTKDEMMLRELVFDEAYISCYGETMNATGSSPMITHFLISPTRLDINRTIRLDRRIKTTYGFWWEEYKEEEKTPTKVVSYSPPLLLVTSVKGKDTALPSEIIRYQVTGYNLSDVSENDRKRIKWVVEVNGKKEVQKERGEVLDLLIKEEWAGEEITVMPYLRKPWEKVSQKTQVKLEAVVVFVNGYWNSGNTDSFFIEPLKKGIAENWIGTQNKRGYWNNAFLNAANSHFQRKYKDWTSKNIEKSAITPIFIDGSNIWNSSGKTRFNAGWDEAELLFNTELVDKQVVNASGNQMKKIFIVSHSMGAAHAEGMIAAWSWHGLKIERILHFSAADNRDFQVKLPACTYQINLMPDPILMYKNADDAAKTKFENFWKMMKRPYLDMPDGFMIERMLPDHYIEVNNKEQSMANHYYTKSGKVWELVPFLKE